MAHSKAEKLVATKAALTVALLVGKKAVMTVGTLAAQMVGRWGYWTAGLLVDAMAAL